MNKGFTAEQVAGIMGNAEQESSWNPLRRRGKSQYWGLFQIDKTLSIELEKLYKASGLDMTKYGYNVALYNSIGSHTKIPVEDMSVILDMQLNFIYNQKPTSLDWITPLRNATSVNEATEVFLVRFEGAKSTIKSDDNKIKYYNNYIGTFYQETAKRRELAQKYY